MIHQKRFNVSTIKAGRPHMAIKKHIHRRVKKNYTKKKKNSGERSEVTWLSPSFEGQGEAPAYSWLGSAQDRWVLIVFSWPGKEVPAVIDRLETRPLTCQPCMGAVAQLRGRQEGNVTRQDTVTAWNRTAVFACKALHVCVCACVCVCVCVNVLATLIWCHEGDGGERQDGCIMECVWFIMWCVCVCVWQCIISLTSSIGPMYLTRVVSFSKLLESW